MKRDMELIRKMVLIMEDHPDGFAPNIEIEGYTDAQIGYHAYLLHSSGLAIGPNGAESGNAGPYCVLRHLTSAGHDFAESARNQFVWDDVMADIDIKNRGGKKIPMKYVGGPRNGMPLSIAGPDGQSPQFLPGCVAEYRYGPIVGGQRKVELFIRPPGQAANPSVPGSVESYRLEEDGDWHYF